VSVRLRSAWWPVLAVVWPAVAGAQALPPTRVTIPKVLVAPTLEDYLPGGAMPGLKVTDFRQREPKDLETPTQPTAGYLSYDASNVYVAFVCTQPRGDVRARMQKREDLGADAWSACISIPSTIGSAPPSSSRRRSVSRATASSPKPAVRTSASTRSGIRGGS
jgi:hypothetical protein